jgi:hypothetical protein
MRYLWEIALHIRRDAPFYNTWDERGIWRKADELNNKEAYVRNDVTCVEFSTFLTLAFKIVKIHLSKMISQLNNIKCSLSPLSS